MGQSADACQMVFMMFICHGYYLILLVHALYHVIHYLFWPISEKLVIQRVSQFRKPCPWQSCHLWDEAVRHAFWIKNQSPTWALNGKTPYEAKYRNRPDMLKVVPFGTHAWVKIVDAGKLDHRAKLGFFAGFDSESTSYRVYFANKCRVNVEREVVFHRTAADASDDLFQM
jgi:hypothetical protein